MDARSEKNERAAKVWIAADRASFDVFRDIVSQKTDPADWPFARNIEKSIPIYDGAFVRDAAEDSDTRARLTAEWTHVFSDGPGIVVIKDAIENTDIIDEATALFEQIIEEERKIGSGGGDHFAKPGANDRVWNAAQKHCLADPESFAAYYATPAIRLASEAWLGDGYQLTAQVNRVNPGGAAQTPHRDYHLGFMANERMAKFPAHVHRLSPALTLQGAIAHCDMPSESGPTMLLPYSQAFFEGYLAFGKQEFQDHFAEHHVQLPLKKGDAMFFNPAVMHGAGNNVSKDIRRMANLLQVGSAFGRSIETVNRAEMAVSLYPVLLRANSDGSLTAADIDNVVAASAEGYAFPTNLDNDPPADGLNPLAQAAIMREALAERWTEAKFREAMEGWEERRKA